MEAWVGNCHLIKGEGEAQEEFQTQAAVFCASREEFEKLLQLHVNKDGLHILWCEEVLPATSWLTRHGHNNTAIRLAKSVHEENRVALADLSAVDADGNRVPEPSYLTITEHEIGPLPNQTGIPFWEAEWIAPDLKDMLFGQPEKGNTLRTYCIVDATLRKNITGFFDLDSAGIDIPIKCLFKGDAAEELKEAAPYLIDMTLPEGAFDDKDKVPAFHKDFFKKHWGQNTGIFVRSTALIEDVRKHFRRFTRIEDTKGKGYFFRFWDARSAPYYFEGLKDTEYKIVEWFLLNEAHKIDAIIMEEDEGEAHRALNMRPHEKLVYERRKFTFTQFEWNLMASFVEERFYKRLFKGLCKEFPEKESDVIKATINHNRKERHNFDLIAERDIYALNRACLKWGNDFYKAELFWDDFKRVQGDTTRLGKYMRLWAA